MKKILTTVQVIFVVLSVHAQGVVDFRNDNASVIRNALRSDDLVRLADGILTALYWAPLSDPTNFIVLGEPVVVGRTSPGPGLFYGGLRTTGPETTAGSEALFIVKAWEAPYGETFEAAASSPPVKGRVALRAQSPILLLRTGVPDFPTFLQGTVMNPGFTGFTLTLGEIATNEPPKLSLYLVPAIGISGTVGVQYDVQYSTLSNTAWITVGTILVTNSSQHFLIDMEVVNGASNMNGPPGKSGVTSRHSTIDYCTLRIGVMSFESSGLRNEDYYQRAGARLSEPEDS